MRTLSSRERAVDGVRRRRYECRECAQRVTTYEVGERTWATWQAIARALRRGSGLLKAALLAVKDHR